MPPYALRGFPEQVSVIPGSTLVLHIACLDLGIGCDISSPTEPASAPFISSSPITEFSLTFYRQGQTLQRMKSRTGWMPCKLLSSVPANVDWRIDTWAKTVYQFPIPSTWQSGVYIAILTGRYWSSRLNRYSARPTTT